MKQIALTVLLLALSTFTFAQQFPTPSKDQIALQDMEMYAFIHYSMNTYTDQEWGYGNEDLAMFNPKNLDCRQWARTCKEAGMKGIIFTAKHHCGFCMWPSEYTEYSVKNTPWKNGKGDVVRELADACKEYGLRFAVYLSPWDRNHAEYGRKEYVTYFRNQLRELLTNYGDMFEVWFDGANGGNGWYGGADETRHIDRLTYYEWEETYRMIRELQPHCVIWNDGSNRRGDLRWIGTEAGFMGETNWSMMKENGDCSYPALHYGMEDGDVWCMGETNTSIRPGWFYHDSENGHVKSLSKLMETYYKSVGRNSTLLLNFPIDQDGLIHAEDSIRGAAFYSMVKQIFDHPLKGKQKTGIVESTLTFKEPVDFNRLMICEDLSNGQDVKAFKVEAFVDGYWKELHDIISEEPERSMTTIGRKRILCLPTTTTQKIKVTIVDRRSNFRNCKKIKSLSAYLAPEIDETNPDNGEKKSAGYNIFFPGSGSPVQSMFIGLGKQTTVTQFRFLPAQGTKDGMPLDYKLSISADDGKTWTVIAEGEFSNIINNPIWQTIKCTPATGSLLKLDCTRITSGNRIFYDDIEVVGEDGMVTFLYQNDNAKKVFVDVQFAGKHEMTKDANTGLWTATLCPCAPDMYPYHFEVDGISVMDPQCEQYFPNEGFKNSLLEVKAQDGFLPHDIRGDVEHGVVQYVNYWSNSLNYTNNAVVYLPPSYYKDPQKKYPVFYLISGTTDTEEVYYKVGRVNYILDNHIAEGKAKEMIVVLPYGNPYKLLPQMPTNGMPVMGFGQDVFSNDIINDLMPYVESHYRTINDSDNRAIGGFSRGGNQGLSVGLHNLDKFSYLCSYSSFTSTDIPGVYNESTNDKLHLFWLGVGTDDFLYGNARDYMEFLDNHGIRSVKEYTHDKFGHTWMNAKYFLDHTLQLLFNPEAAEESMKNAKPALAKTGEEQQFTPGVMARLFPRQIVSPEYGASDVVYRFNAPEAKEVLFESELLNEPLAMQKDNDGVWSITVPDVAMTTFKYCFVVDGTKVADPVNMYLSPDRGFKYSVSMAQLKDLGNVEHGVVQYHIDKDEAVYFSSGEINDVKGNIICLIPGKDDTIESWFKVGRADDIADRLIAEGKVKEVFIYVGKEPMPHSKVLRAGDFKTWKQRSDALEKLLTGKL